MFSVQSPPGCSTRVMVVGGGSPASIMLSTVSIWLAGMSFSVNGPCGMARNLLGNVEGAAGQRALAGLLHAGAVADHQQAGRDGAHAGVRVGLHPGLQRGEVRR